MREIHIAEVSWEEARPSLHAIRITVFVEEQGFAREIELDGRDPDCVHVLARHGDEAIGTARMLPDGHIGRVSVLPAYRRQGVGTKLILALLEIARVRELAHVDLDSQLHAIPFYENLGFRCQGAVFQEAGKPHQNLVCLLRED